MASLKISIGGTFCSGKTTLAQMVCRARPGLLLVEEHAEELKLHIPQISWRDQAIRDYLLVSQMFREARAERQNAAAIVCDSGVVESLAHSQVFGVEDRHELLVDLRHRPYDAVVLCNFSEVELQPDGIRDTDPVLRIELQNAIFDIYGKLGYRPVLVSGPPTVRTQIAIALVEKSL